MSIATLFIISAPSGAGKSSLIKAYLEQHNNSNAKISVSHTTRQPRPGENHAEHYYFIEQTKFEDLIKQDAFVEYAKVFDHYYGTSKSEIDENLNNGINVFLDIDWQGAQQVREKIPEAKSIFILPPSITELEKRLHKRGQDSEQVIQKRMQKAKSEMSHYLEYDYLIINDDFSTSLNQLTTIINAANLQSEIQIEKNRQLITQLVD